MPNYDQKTTFWQWFDGLASQYAKDHAEIAEAAADHNFTIGHTGGGCLALEQTNDKVWLLICDEGNDLPTSLDQAVIAGGTDVDEGFSIIGVDKVTPREFFATCWTFAAFCELKRKAKEFEISFDNMPHMLEAARVAGCIHADEAEAAELIITKGSL